MHVVQFTRIKLNMAMGTYNPMFIVNVMFAAISGLEHKSTVGTFISRGVMFGFYVGSKIGSDIVENPTSCTFPLRLADFHHIIFDTLVDRIQIGTS